MEYVVTEQMRAWGRCNGFNVDEHIEFFNDYLANKSGKPYKDLDAAFRNCVRADWGGLRKAKRVNPLVKTEYRAERTVQGKAVWVPATATTDGYWKRT